MEPEHPETDRNIPSKHIDEKETFCNQYESGRVSGTSAEFLKMHIFSLRIGKAFMRMSWVGSKMV